MKIGEIDEENIVIVEWFQKQTKGITLEWTADGLSADYPFGTSWVDVRVPSLETETGQSWSFTVNGPDGAEFCTGDLSNFIVPFDLDVHYIHDPEYPNCGPVHDIPIPKRERLTQEQEEFLNKALEEGPNRERLVCGGWSANAITHALNEWVAEHAHRSDIHFRWNPDLGESDMLKKALETLERIKQGKEELHSLGTNVVATSQVIETLCGVDEEPGDKNDRGRKNKIREDKLN